MTHNGAQFLRRLDWNLLKIFGEITNAGGISRAAASISRKQPALSLALRRLESQLGAELCRRGPGGFALSDEGRAVNDICQQIRTLVADLPVQVAGATKEIRGQVRLHLVSNLVSHSLDVALGRFHAQYQNVEISIDVGSWVAVAKRVLRNEVDVAISPARLFDGELLYEPVFRETHIPYCGTPHHLFGKTLQNPAQLADHAFILTGGDEADEILQFRLEHGLGRLTGGVSDYLEEAKRLALQGIGICFLPEPFAESDVDAGRLWPLLPRNACPAIDLYMITNPRAPRRIARDMFIKSFREDISSEKRYPVARSKNRSRS